MAVRDSEEQLSFPYALRIAWGVNFSQASVYLLLGADCPNTYFIPCYCGDCSLWKAIN